MFKSFAKTIILIALIALISACGPAATPAPPTATIVPPPPMAVPPTVAPTTSLTVIPPTAAPTPATADSQASQATISADTVDQIVQRQTLSGHTDQVYGLAFTPDARLLASGSVDGTIRLWNVTSGQEVHTLQHSGGVCRVVISPDGTLLASGGLNRTVKLWDVQAGQAVHTFSGYDGAVCGLDFSPDGALLATGSVDQSVKLWDVANRQLLHTLAGHTSAVFSVAFAPDGAWLASGSARPELHIKLWDVESGQEVRALTGQEADVHDLAFSPDGTLLAAVGPMAEVKLWDLASGQVAQDLRGHNGNVFGTAFSMDGTLLTSSSDDGTLKLWDVESGRVLRSLRHNSEGLAIVFSPDGSLLASDGPGNAITLWGIPPSTAGPTATTAPDSPVYWPAGGWRTSTPEEQGMDSELLAEAMDFLLEQNIHSLLIIRNGYIVVDATFYPFTPGTKHDVASVTKSWTATLVGIAIHRGYIASVQQPVLNFFPQRAVANLDANKEAITVEDLLTMRTGFECTIDPTEATLIEMMASPDWVQFALDLPMSEAPGTRWVYCSPGTHLLSAIIQQATGTSALDFAREHLFNPLGISDMAWPTDPQGIIRGYGDMRLTPHDMAKLGYLYLNEGQWDGKQLLPASWVKAATSAPEGAQPQDDGYGYLWWLSPDFYSARGRGGQWIIVSPDKNMIVVLTNGRAIQKLLSSYVFPAAKSTSPLPPNPDGVALLESRIQQATESPQVAPRPVPSLPAIAQKVSGQTYALDANPFGLLTLSLTFQEQAEALLRITAAAGAPPGDEEFEWLVGLDNVERTAPGRFGMPAAAKGFWESGNVFVVQVNEIGNNFSWRLSLAFEDDQVTLAMQDMTGFFPDTVRFGGELQE